MLTEAPPSRQAGDGTAGGFTLVELLVAMSVGIVILFALSSILIVSLHQTQRTFTAVDSTRQARGALATIENELHSACVTGDAPVQAGSDASTLNFLSYYGGGANPTPTWHVLSFSNGTLTDSSYSATYTATSTGHTWTRATNPTSTNTLLSDVAQQSSTVPVFQYYQYQNVYTDASGNLYWMVPDGNNIQPGTTSTTPNNPLTTPLDATSAPTVVEVVINLLAGPSGENLANSSLTSAKDPITDAISLRLTTPPDYVPAGTGSGDYLPCQ